MALDTWRSIHGARYILWIKIDREIFTLGDRKLARYNEPILIDCDLAKRQQNTATVFYSELGGPSLPISRSEARSLMVEISKDAGMAKPRHNGWMLAMIEVIAREGRSAHNANL